MVFNTLWEIGGSDLSGIPPSTKLTLRTCLSIANMIFGRLYFYIILFLHYINPEGAPEAVSLKDFKYVIFKTEGLYSF